MNDVMQGWGGPIRFSRKSAYEFVPTWQRGMAQPTDGDLANFMKEGYTNSLIYACIREVATSFAELPPLHLRPDESGFAKVTDSQLVALLENPSENMDGNEFRSTFATYAQTTGNVYIQKVRRSESRDRNAFFGSVKELGLVRPDYVQIVPGVRRADDIFEIKVNGVVVARLPRADVVHWKTPNPLNDFYGQSPIATLIKEGNLDIRMTEFDLAFFQNAGVPMGLLKTASKPSPDELKEIKGAFRRMFSGVKKWFEIMVLPAKEAEFQQLGLPVKDMEMPHTRELVESRICAVFGVPPILVGALVGLMRATYANYELAQRSFWSETMHPFADSVASVLTRELLPEVRTTADRGARVSFDLSGVQALQEDNTAKLETAAKLIQTGGFTVNEALDFVALPQVDAGDFYVRQINQMIEQPVTARLSRAMLLPSTKELGNRNVPRERLAERATEALAEFFVEQSGRVVGRLPKSRKAPDVGDLLPPEEERRLLEALRVFWHEAAQAGWSVGGLEVGEITPFDPIDPAVRRLLEDAGERVGGISQETRRQLQNSLVMAREQGLSVRQTANLIRDLPAFGKARAETIARTELAIADNKGAVARYRQAGIKQVQVWDGPECGWTSHDDVDHADGSIRDIDDFESYPVAHPRCVRSRGPVIEDSLAGNGHREVKEMRCPSCRKLLVRNGAVKCDRCKEEVAITKVGS